jgi:hypothetical protein
MGKKGIIILLIALGLGAAVVIGWLGESETRADKQLCSSLESLQSSVTALKSIDASTASKSTFQSDVSAVQSAWSNVASDAKDVADIDMDSLDSAWSSFESAVKAVPDSDSVADAQSAISEATTNLETAVTSTIGQADCSISTTTTSS